MTTFLLLMLACSTPGPREAPLQAPSDAVEAAPEPGADAADPPEVVEEEPEEPAEPLAPIRSNRTLEVLSSVRDPRAAMREAGRHLGDWTIHLAGVDFDGPWLEQLADTAPEEPFLRVVREQTGRPLDLDDFLLFLDDVLAVADERRGEPFHVTSGRARSAGILLHPDDVFRNRPRKYGRDAELHVDKPRPQATFPAAQDGDPPGPEWTMRYLNPESREALFQALEDKRPGSGYAARIQSLLQQIEDQGGEAYLTSTLRHPERGYLMWGAFILSRVESEGEVKKTVARLEQANRSWGLEVPITWTHPDGWRATIEAARQMADAYDVVYATERGARYSNHYGGKAADFVALALPRELTLTAPNGKSERFDLSDPSEPRDINLSPRLIRWVEANFEMQKLESDYPHWTDTRR